MSNRACPADSPHTGAGLNTPSQEVAPAGTLVLALGNPLRGDDGVGAAILEALARSESLPQGVMLLDGGVAGLGTALLMQGHRWAIIIDAAEMGLAPGEWARFTPEEVAFQADEVSPGGTLHSAGLAEALALGDALGILPPEIAIYGVQPAEVGWSPGLSSPVQRAISPVCTAILEELYNTVDHKGASDKHFARDGVKRDKSYG